MTIIIKKLAKTLLLILAFFTIPAYSSNQKPIPFSDAEIQKKLVQLHEKI